MHASQPHLPRPYTGSKQPDEPASGMPTHMSIHMSLRMSMRVSMHRWQPDEPAQGQTIDHCQEQAEKTRPKKLKLNDV